MQIRQAVPGYPEQDELFKRMFERDKEELRDLGIPLETGVNHPFDDDPGYRIRQQAYELPEMRLEADEAAVLGMAARVWQRAALEGAAAGRPAEAAGGRHRGAGTTAPAPQGIEPRLGTPEPAFGPLWEAVRDRRPVTFSYRAAGRSEPQRRELEPWGVVNRHGRWYVAGWDRGRGATRVFRLSRIAGDGEVRRPAGQRRPCRTAPTYASWSGTGIRRPAREHTAVLRVRSGRRRRAAAARRLGARRRFGAAGMGPGDDPVRRCRVVRRLRRLVRPGRRGRSTRPTCVRPSSPG